MHIPSLTLWLFGVCILSLSLTSWALTSKDEAVNIVSVVDGSSHKLALIKCFSIIKSTAYPEKLVFYFLVMPILKEYGTRRFEQQFKAIFPGIAVHSRLFVPPSLSLFKGGKSSDSPDLYSPDDTSHYFQRPVMFARLFIPTIFDLDYFVYLDNDIVATMDITTVYPYDLNGLTSGYVHYNNTAMKWIDSVFNLTHPAVKRAFSHRGEYFYFNSGVWFCNASLWRSENWPVKMEDLLVRFRKEGILTSGASDQEVSFILLENKTALLPPRFNMDSEMIKHELTRGDTGLVHFNAQQFNNKKRGSPFGENICRLKYSFVPGTMLFNSVVHSFCHFLGEKRCFRYIPASLLVACRDHVDRTWNQAGKIYNVNPGLGNFTFPPEHLIEAMRQDDDYSPPPLPPEVVSSLKREKTSNIAPAVKIPKSQKKTLSHFRRSKSPKHLKI